jgi:hypothetical protein
MDELINLVVKKTGLSPEDARKAVEVVINALKTKLPPVVSGHLDAFISGGSADGVAALEAEAGNFIKGKLGSLLGGSQ